MGEAGEQCDREQEDIEVGNPDESTDSQKRILEGALQMSLLARLYRRTSSGFETTELDASKVIRFVEGVFSDPIDVSKTESLREWGIRTLRPSTAFPVKVKTRWKFEKNQSFDTSREYNQFAPLPDLWEELNHMGVITPDLIRSIQDHFESFKANRGEQVTVYSNLILSRRPGEKSYIQKLHCDHTFGPGNELVLAIDLSGAKLRTRYYAGSTNVRGFNEQLEKTAPKNTRLMNAEVERGTCRTSLGRAYNLLLEACAQEKPIHYVEADAPMVIFDAGGLHSGNAVRSDGPRVFFTIRTARFHRDYGNYIRARGDQDVWFTQQDKRPLFTCSR